MDIFQGPTQRSSWEEGGGGGKHHQGFLNCVLYNSFPFPISNFPSHWYPDLFFFSSIPFVLPFFSFLPLSSIFFKIPFPMLWNRSFGILYIICMYLFFTMPKIITAVCCWIGTGLFGTPIDQGGVFFRVRLKNAVLWICIILIWIRIRGSGSRKSGIGSDLK